MVYVAGQAPEEEQRLRCVFEQVRKSLFPPGKKGFFPKEENLYQSPWVGKPLTSLLGDDKSEDMLKVLKDQHAYVLAQHNHLIQKHKDTAKLAQTGQRERIQEQQIELVRDMLNGFQESMATMMQLASEMVQKVCEQPSPSAPAPTMFQKTAVSHKRPAIRPIPNQGNAALKVHEDEAPVINAAAGGSIGVASNDDRDLAKPIRVQPHPISKRLERISE